MQLGRVQTELATIEYFRPTVEGVDIFIFTDDRNAVFWIFSRSAGAVELVERHVEHRHRIRIKDRAAREADFFSSDADDPFAAKNYTYPDLFANISMFENRVMLNSISISAPENTPWESLQNISTYCSAQWITEPSNFLECCHVRRKALKEGRLLENWKKFKKLSLPGSLESFELKLMQREECRLTLPPQYLTAVCNLLAR